MLHPPPCALDATCFFADYDLFQNHSKEPYDDAKQCSTFNQCRCKDHVCPDVIHGFRLTGNGFYGTFTDLTDPDTGTDCGKTRADCSTSVSCCIQHNHI